MHAPIRHARHAPRALAAGRSSSRPVRAGTLAIALQALVVGLLALAGTSCSEARPAGGPSSSDEKGGPALQARANGPRLVVLFAVCTLNKDYLSPYNPKVPYTPTFQQLADAGVVFDRHHTEAGQSGNAYASLFTGSQADTHGVYTHPTVVKDDLYLMAEAFGDAGWDPWYWYGHPFADPDLGYAQGVAEDHRVNFKVKNPNVQRLTHLDPELVALLRALKADPRLHATVTINFSYTHGPYTEGRSRQAFDAFKAAYPDEVPMTHAEMERWIRLWESQRLQLQWNFPETRAAMGLSDEDVANISTAIEIAYKSGIYMLDRHLAFFLKTIQQEGVQDELLLAFTADHGQVLYRESALFKWTHGLQLAPEVLNVPLILFAPKLLKPGRYEGVTRSMDVYPTLAGLAGIELPEGASPTGRDLSAAVLGEEEPPALVAWFHSTTISPKMYDLTKKWTLFHQLFPTPEPESLWVGARDGDMLYKWRSFVDGHWGMEAFDLSRPDGIATDVFDEGVPAHAEMRKRLQEYKQRLIGGFGGGVQPEDALQQLKDTGYAGDDDEEEEPAPPSESK